METKQTKLQNIVNNVYEISYKELAEKLDMPYKKVADVVSGRVKLSAEMARKISNVLGCTLEDIID